MSSKDKKAETDDATEKGGGRGKLLLILAVVVLAAAGSAYFFVFSSGEAEAQEPVSSGTYVALEPVAVNLAGGGYLKIGVSLELTEEGAAGGHGGGTLDGSKAKDLVISTFSQADPADVVGARDALKAALQEKIIEAYSEDGHELVMGIYYTEYVTHDHTSATRHTTPGRPAAPRRRWSGSVPVPPMRWNVTQPPETGPAPTAPDRRTAAESRAEATAGPAPSAPPAAATSAPSVGGRSRRGEARTYDFRRPTKLSRDHVRVLQVAQEAFARQATTILTTFLRAGARLELVGIEQYSYDDYLVTLPNPVFITTFTLEPLAGKGLLAYPLDMAMAIVDHMLGGSGNAEQPNRPMTAMESAITNHLLGRLLDEFAASFAPITEIQPALNGFEYNPQLAQAASGSDTVMVATFSMAVGSREGEATLVLPFSSFAQALNNAASPQLSETALAKRRRAAEALTARLNLVPVDVSVRFAPLTVSSADLLSLAVGDVLLLRHPPDAPLEVTTNDVTFAYAIASNHRRRLAASIVPTPYAAAKDTA